MLPAIVYAAALAPSSAGLPADAVQMRVVRIQHAKDRAYARRFLARMQKLDRIKRRNERLQWRRSNRGYRGRSRAAGVLVQPGRNGYRIGIYQPRKEHNPRRR